MGQANHTRHHREPAPGTVPSRRPGRRTRRARAHQVVIKAVATYAAGVLVILMTLRLVQTGFGPLIHIAQYLGWWTVAVVAVSAAVVYPLGGPAR